MDRLRVTTEPVRLLVASEPYLILTAFGYEAAVEVVLTKSQGVRYLLIGPRSLAVRLEEMRFQNGGFFSGLEFWVYKSGDDKKSSYVVDT